MGDKGTNYAFPYYLLTAKKPQTKKQEGDT